MTYEIKGLFGWFSYYWVYYGTGYLPLVVGARARKQLRATSDRKVRLGSFALRFGTIL